ncbi:MAG TPA: NAD(P)-dependent oxidoreductase [Burkholderiales bacterium]|nr:NAD(P)-dependent oxidoreductase [Burkholderiales bacterium]
MSDKPKLGYIGVGLMGKPMVLRLLAAGYAVSVWNRSAEKLKPVLEKGAAAVGSAAEVARAADIVMMCVTDQAAAESVLFGPEGVAAGGAKGKLVVDFSSIAPASARAYAARLEKQCGMGLVDAPVSGGVSGAEQGTLAIMAGGSEADFERARPVVAHLSSRFTRMGAAGAGQATKLCNQIIVGCLFPVLAEAIRVAESAGVDAARLPEALKGGFADSLPLQVFGPRIARRAYDPPIGDVATMLKDLENAAVVAREAGVPLPMARSAAELYRMIKVLRPEGAEPTMLIELLAGRTR